MRILLLLLFIVGVPVAFAEEPPLLRDFIGINGHTVQFRPELYLPVCRLVRDYHPMAWDLGDDAAKLPPFPLAKNGVDWSRVYGSWRAKGWTVDVSLMFETVPLANWGQLETNARAYGEAFARAFGPSGSHPVVDSVEIGNEPGKWSDPDYTRLFTAMAQGVRAGDPRLPIVTCNLSAGKSGDYDKSVACLEKSSSLYDVLNIHTYAQLENWPTWRRSFPEDPRLPHYLQDVNALCQWRDAHAPGKPVWITEFGYDSTTKPAETTGDFTKWVGVTDVQQAQWLVRSLLVFSALPVQRAYLYFFNDQNEPHLHGSSGITRNFTPKPSYWALSHLQKVLGACRFSRVVVNEAGHLRIQEYKGDDGKIVWAVWSPTGEGRRFDPVIRSTPGRLVEFQRMPLSSATRARADVVQQADGSIRANVDESPLYLVFHQ